MAAGRRGLLTGVLLFLAGAYSAFTQTDNSNPQITITAPVNGSTFTAPTNVQIVALTIDPVGDVAAVEFLASPGGGGVKPLYVLNLGTVSNSLPTVPPGSHQKLFAFTWTNALVGTWDLTAQAFTSNGTQEFSSQPVLITVQSSQAFSVDIASPTNGATFSAPANIQLIAGASDMDGTIADVQFFDGTNSLGVVSNGAVVDPPGSPGLTPGGLAYFLTWSNALAGTHVLTAVAMDTSGQTVVSDPVTIYVVSNLPPVVRITSPPNNSVFYAPVNIALLAYAQSLFGYVSNVQFFAGTNSLGFGQPVLVAVPLAASPDTPGPISGPPIFQTNTFELIWSNVPLGSVAVTAVATANTGLSATSTPVNIAVLPPPPPPTNKPDVASIVATDPIAIAGTNCWPWLGLASTGAPPTWSNWVSPAVLWRWFTNCGPKEASFAVCRAGDTHSELTVDYSIGGTASNGVDYAELPGAVTIPAGQRQAMITIVPIDTETNFLPETVILSLTPSTNSPPDYALGFPRRAEVVIIDSEFPHKSLTGAALGDRSFHVCAGGPDGAWFRVDFTTDCINWTPVCTNQVVNGAIDFADPDAVNSPARFYRTVPLPNLPSD
jgi:hypothetical protein